MGFFDRFSGFWGGFVCLFGVGCVVGVDFIKKQHFSPLNAFYPEKMNEKGGFLDDFVSIFVFLVDF